MNKKLILILEDDEDSALLYKTLLEEEGYRCVACESSQEVIDFVSTKETPWVLISDLTFPGPSAKEMIASFKDKKIPIIIISGKYTIAKEAASLGAQWFFSKPFDLSKLLELLKSL